MAYSQHGGFWIVLSSAAGLGNRPRFPLAGPTETSTTPPCSKPQDPNDLGSGEHKYNQNKPFSQAALSTLQQQSTASSSFLAFLFLEGS